MALNDLMNTFFKGSGNVLRGTAAYTTQNFTEANVKAGAQFEFSFSPADLTAGTFFDVVITTHPTHPVIVTNRVIDTDSASMVVNTFKSPTYTGGVVGTTYNLNKLSSNPAQTIIRTTPTVSATGTQCFSSSFGLNSTSNAPGSRTNTAAAPGLARILEPNTTYLIRVLNGGGSNARFRYYVTWYEGPLSTG